MKTAVQVVSGFLPLGKSESSPAPDAPPKGEISTAKGQCCSETFSARNYTPGKLLRRAALGAVIGAIPIALTGGGILLTAAVGAAAGGVIGGTMGAYVGAKEGARTLKDSSEAGKLLGFFIGGTAGAFVGAFKGAVLGGIAGGFGFGPLGGAVTGGVLGAIGIL